MPCQINQTLAQQSHTKCIWSSRRIQRSGAQFMECDEVSKEVGTEVLTVQDSDRADERRWRHIQHALLGCVDCDSFRRPRPQKLREHLLSTAAGYPAAKAAVRAAFPVGVLDPARLRQAGAPYLLDPMRACPEPRSVCLAQVAVVAACVELVDACF